MGDPERPYAGATALQDTPERTAAVSPSIFERLASIAADPAHDVASQIAAILELIADGLDLGLSFLAHVDEETLHIERVRDRAGMGLHEATTIPLRDTYCHVMLVDGTSSLVVEDAAADPRFAALATTRDLGIGAYSGVPLRRADGSVYGTLCTLHPQPRALQDGEVGLLRLAGRLIMQAVEAAELREHEVRYRALTEHSTDLVCILAPDGTALYGSPSYTRVLGALLEELHRRAGSPLKAIHPDDRDRVQAAMLACMRSDRAEVALTCRHRHADGSWRTLEAVATNRLGDPAVRGIIVTSRDVTERVRAAEERDRIFALSQDLMCVAGADGYFKRVNPAFERTLGYSAQELLARPFLDIVHPDDRAATAAQAAALADGRPVHGFENRYRCADGSYRWFSWSIVPVPQEHLVYAVGRDITERREMEEALREAEERLRAVYGAMSCGVLVLDAAGKVVEVNAAGQEIIGLDSAAIRARLSANQHVAEMLREDGSPMPPQERPSHRALVTGVPVRDVVMGFRRLDGSERWVQMDAVPLLDSAGALRHVVVSFTDITGRRSAEETLRHEMERRAAIIAVQQEVAAAGLDLEAVLEHITTRAQELTGASGAVIEMIDGEEMVYRAAGGSAAAHVGLRLARAGSLSGLCTSTGTVLRCDDAESDERVDRAACRRVGVRSMILVPLRLSERIVGVLKVLSPRPDAFGEDDVETLQVVAGVLGAALGQADAFAAVRASEDHLRQLLQNAPIGACVIDEHGVFESVNRQYAVMLGYTPAELIGQHSAMVIPPEERAGVMADYAARLNGRERGQRDFRFLTKEGALKTALAGTVQITGLDGRPRRASFVVDITARKQTEEALQASNRELARSNAELEQFTRVASHDLRSPLSSIGGFAQLLHLRYKGQLDAHADEYLDFITSGVARMQALIDDLLAYARLDSQARPFAPVDCAALARDALANLRATIEGAGATVEVGDLPTVMGDATQLGQLLQNLIANALKFRRREVTALVRLWAERDDTNGGAWVVAVRDNGIGLDPAQATRIFSMFGRLHTHEEYEGTGIGLAVCQKIVERHGGRIWVESEPGQGATFRFTLPATDA